MKNSFKFLILSVVLCLFTGCGISNKNTDYSSVAAFVAKSNVKYYFNEKTIDKTAVSETGTYFIAYDISCNHGALTDVEYSLGICVAPRGYNVSFYNANTHDVTTDEDNDCMKKLFTLNYSRFTKKIQFEIKIEKEDEVSVDLSSFITLYSYEGRINGNNVVEVINAKKEDISLFHDESTSDGICTGCLKKINTLGLEITLKDRKYVLQGIGKYSDNKLVIPDFVDEIAENALEGSAITSVQFNDRITELKKFTFRNCKNLMSVAISDKIQSIGAGAFYGCISLTSVIIPNNVTTIGTGIFYYCSSLVSVTLPKNVSSVGDSLFYGCSSLTSISIPSGVTNIGENLFYGCSQLKSITIPNSVINIGKNAFNGCSSLASVDLSDHVTDIGIGAFFGCSCLSSITIPDSVSIIGTGAFSNCTSLTSVTLSNNMTSIADRMFTECSSLRTITLPNSVTSIGELAFYKCSNLASIVMPSSVTSIGGHAFYSCDQLTDIYFTGTEEEWDAIEKGSLWISRDLMVHFNYAA